MRQKNPTQHRYWILSITILVITSMACGLLTDTIESLVGEEIVDLQDISLNGPLPLDEESLITEDQVFPGADYLFEVIPFGTVHQGNNQHAIRWRLYSSPVTIDDVDNFYRHGLMNWAFEKDEVINDHRHVVLTSNHPLSSIYNAADFEATIHQNPNLGYALLDIEVLTIPAHQDVGRMNIILSDRLPPEPLPPGQEVSIPGDTTLIILVDHVVHDVQKTETPIVETPSEATPATDDFEQTCQKALESSLCTNSHFPPITGLTLVYSVDGHKTQTRQIGAVQTNVQAPGEPPMDSFIVTIIDDDFTVEMEYFCTEEGLSGGDVSQMMLSVLEGQDIQDEGVSFESISIEGVTLPNDISPGDTWESSVEVVFGAPDGVKLITTNTAQYYFDGYETISTPAGTFTTQKIIADMNVEVGALLPDGHFMSLTSVQLSVVSHNAECYGLVKSESDANLELIDIILP